MRLGSARHHGAARRDPAEAAIVADIAFAVGSDRSAIGAAGYFRDHLFAPVGPNPRQPPAADFDQHHRSVRHHHRPLWKFEIGGEHADVGHEILPAFLGRRRIQAHPARATISLRDVMAKSISLAKQSAGMRLCKASLRRGLASPFDAFSSREPVSTSLENALVLHRYPDFQAAIAGERIEILVVSL